MSFGGSAALPGGKAAFATICRYVFCLAAVACLASAGFCIASVLAQNFVVQRIDIVGNRRIPRDTLRSRIFTREGDAYNEQTLRRDFQALWNTQYFEDVRL